MRGRLTGKKKKKTNRCFVYILEFLFLLTPGRPTLRSLTAPGRSCARAQPGERRAFFSPPPSLNPPPLFPDNFPPRSTTSDSVDANCSADKLLEQGRGKVPTDTFCHLGSASWLG